MSLKYGDRPISILKKAIVRYFEFLKFDICSIWQWILSDFASAHKNIAKIGQPAVELW